MDRCRTAEVHKPGISLAVQTTETTPTAFPIPGASPGGVQATPVNIDGAAEFVTTIIHIATGARIPARYHNDGAEAHDVIDGRFINSGVTLWARCLCHPPGRRCAWTAFVGNGLQGADTPDYVRRSGKS